MINYPQGPQDSSAVHSFLLQRISKHSCNNVSIIYEHIWLADLNRKSHKVIQQNATLKDNPLK